MQLQSEIVHNYQQITNQLQTWRGYLSLLGQ